MKRSRRIWLAAALFAGALALGMPPVAEACCVSRAVAVGGVARRHVRRAVVVTGAVASSSAAASQQQTAAANQAAQQSAAAANQATQAANQATLAANQATQAANQASHTVMVGTAVASLPAGCTPAGQVYNCSGVYYKPFFQGNNVVYGVVPAP